VRHDERALVDPEFQAFALRLLVQSPSAAPQIVRICRFLPECTVSFMDNPEVSEAIISGIMDDQIPVKMTGDALKALFRYIQVARTKAIATFFEVDFGLFDRLKEFVLEASFDLKQDASEIMGLILSYVPELFDAIVFGEEAGLQFLEDMLATICEHRMSGAIVLVLSGLESYGRHLQEIDPDFARECWARDSGPRFLDQLAELEDFDDDEGEVSTMADALRSEIDAALEPSCD
jgi:hypothetical protein